MHRICKGCGPCAKPGDPLRRRCLILGVPSGVAKRGFHPSKEGPHLRVSDLRKFLASSKANGAKPLKTEFPIPQEMSSLSGLGSGVLQTCQRT